MMTFIHIIMMCPHFIMMIRSIADHLLGYWSYACAYVSISMPAMSSCFL